MDYSCVIEEAKDYLEEVGIERWKMTGLDNDDILSQVNVLYFGGIQAFVRNRKIEERCRSPSSSRVSLT